MNNKTNQPINNLSDQLNAKKPFWKNVFFLSYLFAIIAMGATAFTTLYYQNYWDNSSTRTTISSVAGNFVLLDGKVQVMDESANEPVWIDATTSQTITAEVRIKTAADAKAVLALDDGSAIRLHEKTEVSLEKLDASTFVINQLEGESYHRVASNSQRQYLVQSQGVTSTAQGTAFNVATTSNVSVVVKVIESQVEVLYDEVGTPNTVESGQEISILFDDESVSVNNLSGENLATDWLIFNKEQDAEINADLGIFGNGSTPHLTITEPTGNINAPYETSSEFVTLKGTTSLDATLKLIVGSDWQYLVNNNGSFEHQVILESSTNLLVLKAFSPSGAVKQQTLSITRLDAPTPTPSATPTEVPTPSPEPKITPDISTLDWGEIEINARLEEQNGRSLSINWNTTGNGTAVKGFKVVWSQSENPTYPQNQQIGNVPSWWQKLIALINPTKMVFATTESDCEDTQADGSSDCESDLQTWNYQYLSSPLASSTTIELPENQYQAGTWYFRVCRYRGSFCDIYSNQITVTVQ